MDDLKPTWQVIAELFERHGLQRPPVRLRDELVALVNPSLFATHAAKPAPVAVEGAPERMTVEEGANSHCFDLRLMAGNNCVAFADEPEASRIAALWNDDLAPTGNTALVDRDKVVAGIWAHYGNLTKSLAVLDAALSQPAAPQSTPEVEALLDAARFAKFALDQYAHDEASEVILDEAHSKLAAALARGSVAEKGER